MERIQPPPNYYGAPYPQPQDGGMVNNPYTPQMGYPTNQKQMPTYPSPEGNTAMMRQDPNIEEFYESFNKLISTNLGRSVNVHCSFTDSTKWHDKEFIGVLASAGDNYIIVYDANNNRHYLIVAVYVDYIEFFDKITMDGVTTK